MPVSTRILAALFFLAAAFGVGVIAVCWSVAGLNAGAGGLSPEQMKSARVLLSVVWGMLVAIYAGAGWALWSGRSWSLAMLLSACAIFGFPIGTALSLAAVVVLSLKSVRTAFKARGESERPAPSP